MVCICGAGSCEWVRLWLCVCMFIRVCVTCDVVHESVCEWVRLWLCMCHPPFVTHILQPGTYCCRAGITGVSWVYSSRPWTATDLGNWPDTRASVYVEGINAEHQEALPHLIADSLQRPVAAPPPQGAWTYVSVCGTSHVVSSVSSRAACTFWLFWKRRLRGYMESIRKARAFHFRPYRDPCRDLNKALSKPLFQ